MKKKSNKHKCIKCKLVPCINFHREINKLEGGEIYVLESSIKNKEYVPCECGAIIYSLCQLLVPISRALSFELFNQCIRDLKASAFLVFTGHYRTAIQILRPIIENWLSGLYWDVKIMYSNKKTRKNIIKEYKKFRDYDKYILPEKDLLEVFLEKEIKKRKYLDQEFILRWLLKRKIIDSKFKDKLQKKIGELNNYLHPNFKTTDLSRVDCTDCPSTVKYEKEEYDKCVKIFQDVAVLLLDKFYQYISCHFPKKMSKSEIKNALGMVTNLEDVQKEIKKQIILSNELKEFISTLRKSGF